MPRIKKEIENYDFILRFRGDLEQHIESWLQPLNEQLGRSAITLIYFYLKEENLTYLLVKMVGEESLKKQAEQLKILKLKDKRSFRLSEKELEVELSSKALNDDYRLYLYFLKARLPNR